MSKSCINFYNLNLDLIKCPRFSCRSLLLLFLPHHFRPHSQAHPSALTFLPSLLVASPKSRRPQPSACLAVADSSPSLPAQTRIMTSNPDSELQNASSSTEDASKPPIEPIHLPTMEEIQGQDIWNNCAVRSVVSGVMGGGLGLGMGLLLGALDNPLMREEMTGRQLFIYQAKQMGQRSWSSCKAFAVMGFVFSAAECVVEKARAKHDITNTVVAGCVTGGVMSARGGPKATCVGCAGFAAFSVVIEKFLERHS